MEGYALGLAVGIGAGIAIGVLLVFLSGKSRNHGLR